MIDHELSKRQRIGCHLLHTTALFLACYFAAGKFAGIHTFHPWHMACAGLTILLLTGIHYAKFKGRMLCLLSVAGGLVLLCLLAGPETFLSFWDYYLRRIVRDGLWNEDFVPAYELVQTTVLAISCYLLQVLLEHFPRLRRLLAAAIFMALLLCMFLKYPVSHPGFVFCFWYLILTLLEGIQQRWEKTDKHHPKLYMMRIMPFCVVYLILMLLAPVSEEPYQWQWVKDLCSQAREYVILCCESILRGGGEDFASPDFSLSGFSGEGRMPGGLQDSRRHVLTLQGSRELVTNVYLTGKVYDRFDGTAWHQDCAEQENDRLLDALETVYAVSLCDALPDNYISFASLNIKYEHFSTAYLFAPLKALRINGCEYRSCGDSLLFGKEMGYGTAYEVYYAQLNLNEPAFYQMPESGPEPDEDRWNQLVRKYTPRDSAPVGAQELEAHRARIRENYAEKPSLSAETRDYLRQITLGAETDLQKLSAIEAELSSYTYTENPGPLPDSVTDPGTFLDYFLLESRQGYCCHFATAFVLLARAEGLPARYVEGFCVPAAPGQSTAVFSDMAHAWPEVYLEGVGWIPFEPTPGYGEIRYTPWKQKQTSAPSQTPEAEPDSPEEDALSAPEALPPETENRPAPVSRNWPIVSICILLLPAAALLLWMLEQSVRRRHYRRLKWEERMRTQIKINFRLLSGLGFHRADEETLFEFGCRVPASRAFISCCEEILYGERPITEETAEIICSEQLRLLALIREKRKLLYPLVRLRLRPYRYR